MPSQVRPGGGAGRVSGFATTAGGVGGTDLATSSSTGRSRPAGRIAYDRRGQKGIPELCTSPLEHPRIGVASRHPRSALFGNSQESSVLEFLEVVAGQVRN